MAVAAKMLSRNYIGFELDKNYAEISEKRIEEIDNVEHEILPNLGMQTIFSE